MRNKIVAANWKMNTSVEEGKKLASEVINMFKSENNQDVKIVLIPPFTHLESVKKLISNEKNIFIGAQNCHEKVSGAYTGEVSPKMLAELKVHYVILGHSERREYFKESNQLLKQKIEIALEHKLTPIFCCGEPLEIREKNKHFELIEKQVSESLFDLNVDEVQKIVIAYEPIWAIGTGVTANKEQVQEVHHFIRKLLINEYNEVAANNISILYGGSVKPSNSKELFACQDVDGGLIGGASLVARDFIDISKSF